MKPVTLILVDDNPRFLSAASSFLGEIDNFVLLSTLEGGSEAVAKAKELQPDIILVDLAMPDIAGLQLIPMLRESIPNIGIVALTVHDNPQYQEAALAAGADAFITKSSILRTLEPTIKEVSEQRSAASDTATPIQPPIAVTQENLNTTPTAVPTQPAAPTKAGSRPTQPAVPTQPVAPTKAVTSPSEPADKLSAPVGTWPPRATQAAAPASINQPASVENNGTSEKSTEVVVEQSKAPDKVAETEASDQFNQILVLDDDPGIRNIYKKALNHKGYKIDLASNLSEARTLLKENVYGVFICDIHVGKERGTDLLAEVGVGLKAKGTQIIMASAYGQYRYMAEDYGSEYFLEKPVSIHTLVTLIERVLEDSQENIKPQPIPTGTPAT